MCRVKDRPNVYVQTDERHCTRAQQRHTGNRICRFSESWHIATSDSGRCAIFSEVTDGHDAPNATSCGVVGQSCFFC